MGFEKIGKFVGASLAVLVACTALPTESQAAKYKSLTSKGYKTGKLTKNQAGMMGWYVAGEGKKFFCKMKVSQVYIGSTKMAQFTSSGRMITLNRKAFHESLGVKSLDLPQLKDLKAGRPRPQDVGYCGPA